MLRRFLALLSLAVCLWVILAGAAVAATNPRQAAGEIDRLLVKESFGAADPSAGAPAPQVDDETFLRRATFDVIGRLPGPSEVVAFVLDADPLKRTKIVEKLLSDPRYGQNWARYWRDVIFFRRSEDRALLAAPALVNLLTEQLNRNVGWDEIARRFITATGNVREEGSTAIIMAQGGSAEDTTAEMSRIFLGIQIQCAQCHNHPTDRWKREQFHELAAFFPRIAVRPQKTNDQISFVVVSVDRAVRHRDDGKPRPELEHHMPDLKDPQAEGKLMKPVFFATGQSLSVGLSDQERREKLAEWMTSPKCHWFSKALVNRLWAELVGRGFCEPVDDMGPDHKCTAPKTLEYLAAQFTSSHYDLKWLLRTIMATDAYQRASRSRQESDTAPMASSCPQRLRGDQLFSALADVLGFDEEADGAMRGGGPRALLNSPRGKVNAVFGYDPSVRRDELAGTIPQALGLMNGPELNRAINGRNSHSTLGRLLADVKDDRAVTEELYLRCLAREPKDNEIATCLEHVRTTGDRGQAFEDILWALLNSTEFLHRR